MWGINNSRFAAPVPNSSACNDEETNDRYVNLTKLQKCFLQRQSQELENMRETSTRKLIDSACSFGFTMGVRFLGAPAELITRPINTIILVTYFSIIYGFLFWANIAFVIANLIGLKKHLEKIIFKEHVAVHSPNLAVNVCNWMDRNILVGKEEFIQNSREVLTGEVKNFHPVYHQTAGPELSNLKLLFDRDVACSLLLMCASVYERDPRFIKDALKCDKQSSTTDRELWLLRSEQKIHRFADSWGLKFICVPDFRGLDGPFIGVFYKIDVEPDENPFAVITVKGTSPDNFSEWMMDCACKFESASDFLNNGSAHHGFYNTLFPSKTNKLPALPYGRIIDVVRLIVQEAHLDGSRQNKSLNLFVTGHSLGAGIAQLLYARLLETPSDLGKKIVLRDAYVFGTPRACDFKLASRVDYNLNKSANKGRQLWRISNKASLIGDVVTRVPPGLADQREIRSGLQEGSSLSYAAIGTRVDLLPNGKKRLLNPFSWFSWFSRHPTKYEIGDTLVGFEAEINSKTKIKYEMPPTSVLGSLRPFNIIGLTTGILTSFLPCIHDHFPACYLDSLAKMETEPFKRKGLYAQLREARRQQAPNMDLRS
ncbi:hypothetical protein O181_048707 [Austropuccinia psidii MF-1]|uniref:Fungal lipase-type domain-containing protein n=1 Tax=Austropuccinia psidii MF-1 TaxID=1389203 RepID=A0A9Q3HLW3_9BASI|nr:hypothetical protein [Austropuccinia psidii MF-1]